MEIMWNRLVKARTPLAGLVVLAAACGEVREPPAQPAKVPVRSELVRTSSFRPVLALYGTVEPASRTEVRPLESGVLTWAPRFAAGLRTGERVRQGETLFTIGNEELDLAHTEAELDLSAAEAELERAERGVDGGFLPEAELKRREIAAELARERLKSLVRRLERLEWTVPRSGVLSVDRVVPGGTEVAAGTVLAEIAGDGRPRVEAWATTSDLQRLELGLEVDCRMPGSDSVVGRGALAEIAGEVDRGGTVRLVVTIEEDVAMPPPGEGLELDVRLTERAAALTLPEEAVIVDGGVSSVFVLEPSGSWYKARLRPVRPGSRSGGRVEILDGLRAGERVAVEGTELLDDGLLAVEAEGAG